MHSKDTKDRSALIEPWYRQFWPWFLIAVPATSVIAGIFMIFVAFNTNDVVFETDSYTESTSQPSRD